MPANEEILKKLSELKQIKLGLELSDINKKEINKDLGLPTTTKLTKEQGKNWLKKFKRQLDKKVLMVVQKLREGHFTNGDLEEEEGGNNRENWGAFEWLMEFQNEIERFLVDGDKKQKLNALINELDVLLPQYIPGYKPSDD